MREEFENFFVESQKKSNDNEVILKKVVAWLVDRCKKRTEKQFTLNHKAIRQYFKSKGISFPYNHSVRRIVKKSTQEEPRHKMAKKQSDTVDRKTPKYIICEEENGIPLLEVPNSSYVSSKELQKRKFLDEVNQFQMELENVIAEAK